MDCIIVIGGIVFTEFVIMMLNTKYTPFRWRQYRYRNKGLATRSDRSGDHHFKDHGKRSDLIVQGIWKDVFFFEEISCRTRQLKVNYRLIFKLF